MLFLLQNQFVGLCFDFFFEAEIFWVRSNKKLPNRLQFSRFWCFFFKYCRVLKGGVQGEGATGEL